MVKEKIAVLSPMLPSWKEIRWIKEALSFLENEYELIFLDSLDGIHAQMTLNEFLDKWQEIITQKLWDVRILFGFSLGGAILQQFFESLALAEKRVVLFSTPSFIDGSLRKKLEEVIALAKPSSIASALKLLNQYVMYPEACHNSENCELENNEQASLRTAKGLSLLMEMNAIKILKQSKVNFKHFIGQESALVNEENVVSSENLVVIPKTGMRVLQQAPILCQEQILQFLRA
ncbi:MAG: hypothetical protein K0S08_750 [Gammaproteobacteria bacterium]|jgi:hypothetical protein|nr:hypothetical protein [Gammaproteobacteria bacterium]